MCSYPVVNDPGEKKPLLTLQRGEVIQECGTGSEPPWSPSGGLGLWQELRCFLPLTRRKGGQKPQIHGTHFQMRTYPTLYSCPLQQPLRHLLACCWLQTPSCPPRTGTGCVTTSPVCKQPVGTSERSCQPLHLPHGGSASS